MFLFCIYLLYCLICYIYISRILETYCIFIISYIKNLYSISYCIFYTTKSAILRIALAYIHNKSVKKQICSSLLRTYLYAYSAILILEFQYMPLFLFLFHYLYEDYILLHSKSEFDHEHFSRHTLCYYVK